MTEQATPAEAPAPEATETPEAAPAPEAPAKEPVATLGQSDAPDKPAAVQPEFPHDWREKLAGDDEKFLSQLKRYQTPQSFAKSWAQQRAKLSEREEATRPPKPEAEEAIAEWRAKVGLPDKPEGYLATVPDGVVFGEEDEAVLKDYLEASFEADVPPADVHRTLQWYKNFEEKQAEAQFAADAAYRQESEDALREEWGQEFRPTVNNIRSLLTTYGSKELMDQFFTARTADGRALGDNPDVLRMLAGVAREINPFGIVTPVEGKTALESIRTEKAAIEAEMADNKSSYWKDEGKQARYRELIQLEQRHA